MIRKYGWHRSNKDLRDNLYLNIRPDIVLPEIVDLRPKCSPVFDQGELGSCTANALIGAMEFNELREGQPLIPLSRLFLYFNERNLEDSVDYDSGASLRDGIKSLNKQGVCSEEDWPYVEANFTFPPTLRCYDDAIAHEISSYHGLITLKDMQTCLAEGYPFVCGISVYESMESEVVKNTGKVPMPSWDEHCLGGHAMCAVGYELKKQVFIVRNSWGVDWGMSGYCEIPFEYIKQLGDDFWVIHQ